MKKSILLLPFFHPTKKLLHRKKRVDVADQTAVRGNLNKDDDQAQLLLLVGGVCARVCARATQI